MPLELAKELRDAGFPNIQDVQHRQGREFLAFDDRVSVYSLGELAPAENCFIPALEELIEACEKKQGYDHFILEHLQLGWFASIQTKDAQGYRFEVIHLYGTKSGWDRLKELVDAHKDAEARHQAFVDLIAPAARNIHAYWIARRAQPGEAIRDPRQPIHKIDVPGRNDLCPCGSGKKFKRCHGAPSETAH